MEELKQRSMHRVLSEIRDVVAEKQSVDWTPIEYENGKRFISIEERGEQRIVFHVAYPHDENIQYRAITISTNPGSASASLIEGRIFTDSDEPLGIREDLYEDMPECRPAELDDLLSLRLLLEEIKPKSRTERVREYLTENRIIGRLLNN